MEKLLNLAELYYLNGLNGMKYIPFKTRLGIFLQQKSTGDRSKNKKK